MVTVKRLENCKKIRFTNNKLFRTLMYETIKQLIEDGTYYK